MKRNKKIIFYFFYFFILVVSCELLLRMFNYTPYKLPKKNEFYPYMFEGDSLVGYKSKPGIYEFSMIEENKYPVKITISKDGTRSCKIKGNTKNMIVIGDSATSGWAVSDGKHMSDLICKKKKINVENYAIAGKGGLPGYLIINERLKPIWMKDKKKSPLFILYGLIHHHIDRDTIPPSWVEVSDRHVKNSGFSQPFMRLKNSKLKINYFNRSPLPFRNKSSVINLLDKLFYNITFRINDEEKWRTHIKMVQELKKISDNFDIKLIFFMHDVQDNHAEEFQKRYLMANLPIPINCTVKNKKIHDFVPNDGHPGPKMHNYYSDCIIKEIERIGLN